MDENTECKVIGCREKALTRQSKILNGKCRFHFLQTKEKRDKHPDEVFVLYDQAFARAKTRWAEPDAKYAKPILKKKFNEDIAGLILSYEFNLRREKFKRSRKGREKCWLMIKRFYRQYFQDD